MSAEIITWDGKPITEPGLYDMPAAAYFGDALPAGLSQSSAKVLLEDGGPARFKAAQELPREEKKAWDLGTTAHALILGEGAERIKVLEFDNFRTKAAQEARDKAYAEGLTPMLTKDYEQADAIAKAVPAAIRDLFTGGQAEVSMLWQHPSGLWLRGQMDYYGHAIVDLKTMNDASKWGFERAVHKFRYYFQAAWYRRLVKELTGETLPYLIVGVETAAPHLTRVMELTDDYLAIGERDMDRAIATYLHAVETGVWPGYTDAIEPLDPPHWLATDDASDTIAALEEIIGEGE